jgi:predicted nucleic acid-binding Zn ribbon protein
MRVTNPPHALRDIAGVSLPADWRSDHSPRETTGRACTRPVSLPPAGLTVSWAGPTVSRRELTVSPAALTVSRY